MEVSTKQRDKGQNTHLPESLEAALLLGDGAILGADSCRKNAITRLDTCARRKKRMRTGAPSKSATYRPWRISRASSEWPTSSNASVASLPAGENEPQGS
jgi:hypothetical protein